MIIIVDTNIIISACLNAERELFKILLNNYPKTDFVAPNYSIVEIQHHKTKICQKCKTNISAFEVNLSILTSQLMILNSEELSESIMRDAELFAAKVDIDDTIFVAFLMALDSLLWTGDLKLYRSLRRNGFNNVIRTKELKQILKGL